MAVTVLLGRIRSAGGLAITAGRKGIKLEPRSMLLLEHIYDLDDMLNCVEFS